MRPCAALSPLGVLMFTEVDFWTVLGSWYEDYPGLVTVVELAVFILLVVRVWNAIMNIPGGD